MSFRSAVPPHAGVEPCTWLWLVPHARAFPCSNPTTVLEEGVLKEPETRLGRPMVLELIANFRKQLDATIGIIASTVDRERLAWEVHSLVSFSGNLGCIELLNCSRELMVALKDAQNDVAPLVTNIAAAANRALVVIDARYLT